MDDNNMGDKIKEGVSVQELENWGKKYGFEITFLVYFILASIFTFVFFGPHWSIYLAGIGGALGVWLPGIFGFTTLVELLLEDHLLHTGFFLNIAVCENRNGFFEDKDENQENSYKSRQGIEENEFLSNEFSQPGFGFEL